MKSVSTFLTFCMLACALAFAALQIIPVPPISENSTEELFSAERAMHFVEKIASEPHPSGSEAHKNVKNYILTQAKGFGYETNLQATSLVTDSRTLQMAFVENILVRQKGTDSTQKKTNAVVVACHYDSRSNAAGAADDGAAAGAMLEIMRMLKEQKTSFKNDLIFLFTDAEEIDLLGAKAFMEQHEWAKQVGIVFNFEARGGGGMSILFETSTQNQNLLHHTNQAFTEAKQRGKFRAFGTSFANLVYQHMPNGTDASVFGSHRVPFLNFAFIDKHTHYHTPLDRPAHLDQRSLQQHGNYMLALIRYFGNLDNLHQEISATKDVIFLGIPFGRMLVLDINQQHLVWAVYGMLAFFVLVLLIGIRAWSPKLLFGSFIAYLPIVFVIGGLITLTWSGILNTHSAYDYMPYGTTYFAFWYQVAFALIGIGLIMLVYAAFFYSQKPASVLGGTLPYWIGLSALTVFSQSWINIDLRPAAYLFVIPTLSMLVAWLYLLLRNNAKYLNPFDTFVLLSLCVPTVYIFYPVLAILPVALEEIYISKSLTLYGFAVMAGIIALLGMLLVPMMQLLIQGWRWSLSLFLVLLGIGILIWGAFEANFTAEKPKPNSLFCVINADNDSTLWLSYDKAADEFTNQVLGEKPQKSATPFGLYPRGTKDRKDLFLTKTQKTDTAVRLPSPMLSVLSDSVLSDSTYLHKLLIKPSRKGEWIQIFSPNLTALWQDTTRIPFREHDLKNHNISLWAVPDSGAVLTVETSIKNPLFVLSEIKYGLHEVDSLLNPRNESMMAAPYPYSESVIVQKKYTIMKEEN